MMNTKTKQLIQLHSGLFNPVTSGWETDGVLSKKKPRFLESTEGSTAVNISQRDEVTSAAEPVIEQLECMFTVEQSSLQSVAGRVTRVILR